MNNVRPNANAITGDFMLIIYLLLVLFTMLVYEAANFIIQIFYMVKISILVNRIESTDDLLYMKTRDFEHAVAEVFRRQGYRVRISDHFGEGGNGIILDDKYYVIARKDSLHSLVEIELAKKLAKHMRDNGIYRGMIITLGDFKSNTKNYCHINVIKCINGEELIKMFKSVQSLPNRSVLTR